MAALFFVFPLNPNNRIKKSSRWKSDDVTDLIRWLFKKKRIQLGICASTTKQSPDCFSGHLYKAPSAWLFGGDLKRKKPRENSKRCRLLEKQAPSQSFVPPPPGWNKVARHVLYVHWVFQNRLSLQWDYLNPIVAGTRQMFSESNGKRNNVVSNCGSFTVFSNWV